MKKPAPLNGEAGFFFGFQLDSAASSITSEKRKITIKPEEKSA
jgi:hypothetical protein